MGTLFTEVYNRFFGKITDDMYLELTPEDTLRDARQLLIDAIPSFEFPRKKLTYVLDTSLPDDPCDPDYTIDGGSLDYVTNKYLAPDGGDIDDPNQDGNCHCPALIEDSSAFDEELTDEEINILALLMMCAWVQRQVTSIENTRMKYSGPDFKMTSQANHLSKLLSLLAECQRQEHHLQRLYKRRRYDENGVVKSNWSIFRKPYVD